MVLIPTRIHVFVAIKGGKLFEYFVSAEARNEEHTVRKNVLNVNYSTENIH